MFTRGNFHIHTDASDGTLSACEVVNLAYNNNFDVISITDHDNIDSIDKAKNAAKNFNLKIIPGIELSTTFNDESIHILGYFKDNSYKDIKFNQFLDDLKEFRIKRCKKIVENLKMYFNINLNFNEIIKDSKGVIARPNIARAIIKNGYKYSFSYIFSNILNKESPAYIPNKKILTNDGIKLLKSYNAIVVLAHPVLIHKNSIENMLKFNFDGIEAIYPLNTPSCEKYFIEIANKNNLLITAGSDFHTLDLNDKKHAQLNDVELTGDYLKNFLSALNKF